MMHVKRANSHSVATLLICSLLVAAISGTGDYIEIGKNYHLSYQADCDYVHFNVEAHHIYGWVGLGFNDKGSDILGADLFIAGWSHADGEEYWGDFHVPNDPENFTPVLDRHQDWESVSVYESVLGVPRTGFSYSRRLLTGDTEEDVDIKNAPIYVIWAYHEYLDNVTATFTHAGSVELNLLADLEEECPGVSTEPSYTTDSIPSTTEPSLCPPSGTDLIPHPTSCSLYFVCVGGHPYEQECGEGLHFNPITKVCDFPENVNCTKPLPECPPDGVSFYPYPGNCSLYVICAEGTPSIWPCAVGTCFDPEEQKCLANGTLIVEIPRHFYIEKDSSSFLAAESRCGQGKSNDSRRVPSITAFDEFYICDGGKFKAAFRCPPGHIFDVGAQNCRFMLSKMLL